MLKPTPAIIRKPAIIDIDLAQGRIVGNQTSGVIRLDIDRGDRCCGGHRGAKYPFANDECGYGQEHQTRAALGCSTTVIIDCLIPELYRGSGDRHLWGQRPGHIPGAVNVPYLANIDPRLADVTAAERERLLGSGRRFTFCSSKELSALYEAAGVTPDRDVITYCGRGYAAACGLLALKILGHENVRLYDGSWTEWSADASLPAEVNERRPRKEI